MSDGAILRDSTHKGPIHLDRYSCVTKCSMGSFIGIGCFTYISRCSIGNFSSIGSRCSIGGFNIPLDWLSTGAFQWDGSPWKIMNSKFSNVPSQSTTCVGHDVWICDNSVILQGVTIGNGSVIGAGSVVTKDVPHYAIVAGNPAKILRFRFRPQIINKLLKLSWWDIENIQTVALDWHNIDKAIGQIEQYVA